MSEHWEIYADWNPWHGCTKVSPGCKYCYVYRQDEMYGSMVSSSECRKTGNFYLTIRHKSIIASPLITALDLTPYLDATIEEVSVGGESGVDARPCNYDWILALREQCVARDITFRFHQTGARFIKDGKMYYVKRCYQLSQAHKANIDYRIGKYLVPGTVRYEWKESDYHD